MQFNKWNLFYVVTTKTCYSSQIFKKNPGNVSDPIIHGYHLIKGAPILTLEKLSSKEWFNINNKI